MVLYKTWQSGKFACYRVSCTVYYAQSMGELCIPPDATLLLEAQSHMICIWDEKQAEHTRKCGCLPLLVTKLREPFAYVKASCLIALSRKLQPPTRHSISSSFSRISPSFSCKQMSNKQRQKAEPNGAGQRCRQKAEARG